MAESRAERAAERAAEKAADAIAEAEKADLAVAREAAGTSKVCPTCHGELIRHPTDDPHKGGCYHCNTCGICWTPDLKGPR